MFTGDMSNLPPQPRVAFHIVSLKKWGILTYVEDLPATVYEVGFVFHPKNKNGNYQCSITFKVEKVGMYVYPYPQVVVLSSPVGDVHHMALESPVFNWERSELKHYRDIIDALRKG